MNETTRIIFEARKEGRSTLTEPEAKTICMEYQIPIAQFQVAKSAQDALKSAKDLGYPTVLKIVSPDILHKSDIGGVMIDLKNDKDVETAYDKIMTNVKNHLPDARIAGILVQHMIPSSTEVIVGGIKDPQFGPTVMFGLGGIFVEIMNDASFKIAPITEEDSREMVCGIKAYPLLKGYRNSPPVDIDAIVRILMDVSRLIVHHTEIRELDLNPIMVYERGATTVDARIILG